VLSAGGSFGIVMPGDGVAGAGVELPHDDKKAILVDNAMRCVNLTFLI